MKNKEKIDILNKVWEDLKEAEMELGGVPYWTGKLWEPQALKRVNPAFIDLMSRVKKTLDPQNIIHPKSAENVEIVRVQEHKSPRLKDTWTIRVL